MSKTRGDHLSFQWLWELLVCQNHQHWDPAAGQQLMPTPYSRAAPEKDSTAYCIKGLYAGRVDLPTVLQPGAAVHGACMCTCVDVCDLKQHSGERRDPVCPRLSPCPAHQPDNLQAAMARPALPSQLGNRARWEELQL